MRQFEDLREKLLRAGIPPRHVKRYVTELREHLADLEEQERAAGLGPQQARERALILLGSEAQLAQSMIRVAPRSLAARAPWSVLALLPVLLLLCAVAATGNLMFHLPVALRGLAPSDMPAGYASLIATVSFVANYLIGPLLAAGCIAAALRQRLSSAWIWVGLALIALVSGFLGFHMHVVPATDGGRGSTVFSALGAVYRGGRLDPAATLGIALLRAAVLFAAATIAYRALQARFIRSGRQS
jgi:hypothetical protein